MRVLIADDQKSVGTSLAEMVSFCNHQVVEVVGSGLEAIQAYAKYQPDVVLMDYWMPKLNGATACRNILARDPAARIILVSGWSPADDIGQAGALTILAKPVGLERLEAALNDAVLMPVLEPMIPDLEPMVPDLTTVSGLEPMMSDLEPTMSDLEPMLPELEPMLPDVEPMMSDLEPMIPNLQPMMPDFG